MSRAWVAIHTNISRCSDTCRLWTAVQKAYKAIPAGHASITCFEYSTVVAASRSGHRAPCLLTTGASDTSSGTPIHSVDTRQSASPGSHSKTGDIRASSSTGASRPRRFKQRPPPPLEACEAACEEHERSRRAQKGWKGSMHLKWKVRAQSIPHQTAGRVAGSVPKADGYPRARNQQEADHRTEAGHSNQRNRPIHKTMRGVRDPILQQQERNGSPKEGGLMKSRRQSSEQQVRENGGLEDAPLHGVWKRVGPSSQGWRGRKGQQRVGQRSGQKSAISPNWMWNSPFVLVTSAVLWDRTRRKALISKRQEGKRYAGTWEFPGGKVEGVEYLEDCLMREVKEEVGAILYGKKLEPAMFALSDIKYGRQVIMFLFVCRASEWEVKSKEGQELRWASKEEFENGSFSFATLAGDQARWLLSRLDEDGQLSENLT